MNLSDYLNLLWKYRFPGFVVIAGIMIGAVTYSFTMPSIYRSEGVILVKGVENEERNSDIFSGIEEARENGLGSLLVSVVSSRALYFKVVQNAEVKDIFFDHSNTIEMATNKLRGMISVQFDSFVLPKKIRVIAESDNPNIPARVARAYLIELHNFMSDNALTSEKRSQFFIEKELAQNKEALLAMGKTLSEFYNKNSVSALQAKLDVPVTNHTVRDVPHQVYLKYLTVQQTILENTHTLLSESYEAAKLEVAKENDSFTILDEPIVPRLPFKPNRVSIAVGVFVLSIIFSVALAFFMEFGYSLVVWGKPPLKPIVPLS